MINRFFIHRAIYKINSFNLIKFYRKSMVYLMKIVLLGLFLIIINLIYQLMVMLIVLMLNSNLVI